MKYLLDWERFTNFAYYDNLFVHTFLKNQGLSGVIAIGIYQNMQRYKGVPNYWYIYQPYNTDIYYYEIKYPIFLEKERAMKYIDDYLISKGFEILSRERAEKIRLLI